MTTEATAPAASGLTNEAPGERTRTVINLLIVDDQLLVRRALGDLFEQEQDIHILAECQDGAEAVEVALRVEPDVVLMDESMPTMTGLEATRQLLAIRPDMRIVMLTSAITRDKVCRALELGAVGYLAKGEGTRAMTTCVRAVAAGYSVWSRSAAEHLLDCS